MAAARSSTTTTAAAVRSTTAAAVPTTARAAASTTSSAVSSSSRPASAAVSSGVSSGAANSTSINTWGTVTTTASQIVPASTTQANKGGGSTSSFPVAAIAVISVIGGLIAIFVGYKLYVWWYRHLHASRNVPYPDARPRGGPEPPSMKGAWASGPIGSSDRVGLVAPRRHSSSMAFSEASWNAANEKDYSPPPSAAGFHTPIPTHRDSSPTGSSSRLSLTRASISSNSIPGVGSTGGRRSLYGPHAYNGPQMRSMPSSNRLSGAPHAPHSRIDIVTPLPLAPPPGAVVMADKTTLDFSPLSGIGTKSRPEEWFNNVNAGPVGMDGYDRDLSPSGSGSRSASGSGSQHSFPPTPASRSRALPPRSDSPHWEPHHSRPPSSASGSDTHRVLPPIVTALPGSGAYATSPLEKLQQRIASQHPVSTASSSSGSEKKSHSTSEGGKLSGSSSAGTGSLEDIGGYKAPREQLEELIGTDGLARGMQ